MPQKVKEVDAVVIGVGFAGSILAKELAASGLKVVGLERGRDRQSVPDFQAPAIHDELKYSIRKSMMQDVTPEAMTFRNHHKELALPIRQWEAFLPGTGLGRNLPGIGTALRPIRIPSGSVRQNSHPAPKRI